jgi:hypothetical protein
MTNDDNQNDFDKDDKGMQSALQQGRLEGIQAGQESGFLEGQKLGQITGVNYGMELGFTMGMVQAVQAWLLDQRQKHEHQSKKKMNDQETEGQVIHERAQPGVQLHSNGENNTFVLDRIEKTVLHLQQAIQEFPTIQDLFRRQPPAPPMSDDGNTTTTTTTDKDYTSSTSQNETHDIRQKLQRIRTLCKLLAVKLGMPHHSLSSVLQQPVQPIEDVDPTLTIESKINNIGLNNYPHQPGNRSDTDDW